MGSEEERFPDEQPRHRVELASFFVQVYPVTISNLAFLEDDDNRDWRPGGCEALRWADQNYLAYWQGLDFPEEIASHPVVDISWHTARAYASWAGMRLPTEAEWEYAARAGTEEKYWWGDLPNPGRQTISRRAKAGRRRSVQYPANSWGLFDMLGNVAEWCEDWYEADYYQRSEPQNPQGPPEGVERVIRGGAYHSVADYIRCSARAKAGR